MTATTFPGGTSVTFLDVYDDAAPDGIPGGSPHLHLASTECYVVLDGSGELHTLDLAGPREIPLQAGSVVWFTPGTIHRAVNRGGLRVLVIMSNAGLPEAGDAVMTFPADVVADPARYRAAAALPDGSAAERADAAARRRDLAVTGYLDLRRALERGDAGPLRAFHAAAAAIVRPRASSWEDIVAAGPAALSDLSLAHVAALATGSADHLAEAAVRQVTLDDERGFGMCGRLRALDARS
ncbi:cupin domain-containing protein [Microbacterium oleivorans]|uniref:Cupin domain-containing protein n=1 Tax=Microbacterium oleivorans TaxID=273677 RepID=A0A4R5YMN5_9MICO|nr:cupin domain-containing protein [Microbacterium oleivorans]TDL45941.1 cupin domain-containing protein [Microbacterium oleivorans]